MQKLRNHNLNNLERNQFGFTAGVSIDEAKIHVISEIKKRLSRVTGTKAWEKRPIGAMIDLKQAYDSINREKLYSILENQKILEEEEF